MTHEGIRSAGHPAPDGHQDLHGHLDPHLHRDPDQHLEEHPHGEGRPDGDDGHPTHDWIGHLLTRLIRSAGLLQPDHPLHGHPVSLSEGLALFELAGAAPLAQRDLGERLDLEKSTVSRLVAGLERRGLVARRRDPANRRFYQLTLTEEGLATVHRLTASMREHHERLLAAMTPTEREALATGVSALLRAMGQVPPAGPWPGATGAQQGPR